MCTVYCAFCWSWTNKPMLMGKITSRDKSPDI